MIARKRNGRYVVLTAQDDRNVFVTVREFGPRTGFSQAEEWKIIEPSFLAKWDIAYSSAAWNGWNRRASTKTHLSDPEIHALAEAAKERLANDGTVFAVSYKENLDTSNLELEFKVYYIEGEFSRDEAHPLTGKDESAKIECKAFKWERKGGVVGLAKYPSRGGVTSDLTHWGGSYEAKTPKLWESYKHTRAVWLDQGALTSFMQAKSAHAESGKTGAIAARRLRHALDSVREQWTAREWASLKAKFLEEYLDLDLWEDHQKSIKHPQYPAGYNQTSSLQLELTALIEAGIAFDGLNVQQVSEAFADAGLKFTKDNWGRIPSPKAMDKSLLDIVVHDLPEVGASGKDE